jgi:acyl-CoA synthetase (AMP-forming)/AMP-acid ligase II
MPKTIAITPSWYWPAGIARITGIPPFSVYELCVRRSDRDRPQETAIVAGNSRLSAADLRGEVDRLAAPLAARAGTDGRAILVGESTVDMILMLLGALAAGLHLRIVRPGTDLAAAAREFGASLILDGPGAVEPAEGTVAPPPTNGRGPKLNEPAVTIDGANGPVSHSHRSLLAGALGLVTFLDARPERPWLATLPLWRWEGLVSVIIPLYLGATLVLPPPGADAEGVVQTIAREGAGFAFTDIEEAAAWTRDAKKGVKDARRILEAILLSTQGMFDPDDRRRISRSFECPALTTWGMPETGAVFASHQSWYLDESIGIPVSNVHVVPADPRTGTPIQALWELVESAEVTVRSPSLMCGYEGAEHPERFVDGRFRTGMIASSDANGMIYLLG